MCISKIQDAEHQQCFHNPGMSLSPSKRFLYFFLNRNKLMDTYTNTAACSGCGVLLCVPKFFSCTVLKCLYGLIAAFLEFLLILISTQLIESEKWFVVGQFFVILVSALMIRSISTAILSFGQWDEQKPINNILLRYYNDPIGHKQRTCIIAMSGIILAMMCLLGRYTYIFLGITLAIINISIGIITKTTYNFKGGLVIALGDFVLLTICLVWDSSAVLIVSTGIGFVLCYLSLYFYFKYIDDRKLEK